MALRSFLTTNARDGGLFQSDEWARLQTASEHEAIPFQGVGFEGHGFVHVLPLIGRYLFIPRGPIIEESGIRNQESGIRAELLRIAEECLAGWIRIEPQSEEVLGILRATFGADQIVTAPRDTNPRETLMASLGGEPSDWLERMKPKTRYNVRLAEKHGVMVRFSRATEDVETFLELITSTASRKAIAPHPKAYYRNFFAAFPETMCTIAFAEHLGKPVAAALLVFFEGVAYYLHGGSADAQRELMAPFLLQFKCMEEAKRRGCQCYDFGGVHTKKQASQSEEQRGPSALLRTTRLGTSWEGITRFKQGFAPKEETILFPGTYDIILSPLRYALYLQSRRLVVLRRAIRTFVSRIPL